MITEYHDELTARYPDHDKILELLSWNYNLLDMRNYVKTYIVTCNICSRAKMPHHKLFGLLQPLPILDRVWESMLTDFIVKLLPSRDPGQLKRGEFNSIWVVVDRLMKMIPLVPCNELITSE